MALMNWRPITLFDLSYKIYAKELQFTCNQLTQKTISWTKHSEQDLLFLKLNFSKAYDMVDWSFMFTAIKAFGFPGEFVFMLKILFQEVGARVKVNGSLLETFAITKGVRQGCLVASYLFLLVAEVLNTMVSVQLTAGRVQGI